MRESVERSGHGRKAPTCFVGPMPLPGTHANEALHTKQLDERADLELDGQGAELERYPNREHLERA